MKDGGQRMKKQAVGALTLALVLFLLLTGCGKKEEEAAVLTGVRSAVSPVLPSGAVPRLNVLPERNGETGELFCAASVWNSGDGGYGESFLVRVRADGCGEPVPLPLGENESLLCGQLTDGILWWVRGIYGGDGGELGAARLERFEPDGGGSEVLSEDVLSAFPDGNIMNCRMCADRAGNLVLASDGGIAVYAPNGSLRAVRPSPGGISSLTVSADGEVWLGYRAERENVMVRAAKIDGETGTVSDPESLPEGVTAISAGDGKYRLFYLLERGKKGIYGRGEEGEDALLMDCAASNAGAASFWLALSSDAFLFSEGLFERTRLLLFTPAADVDLSEVPSLTIAVPFWRSSFHIRGEENEAITEFRRVHPGVQIVFDDCERYRVPDADLKFGIGEYSDEIAARILNAQREMDDRLTRDIVTGLYAPDLLFAHVQSGTVIQICRRGLYEDLVPYLKKDGAVRLDDLMDNVKRIYGDGRGGIWGLSRGFTLSTGVTSADRTPELCEKGYMTLSDVLECVENLPEGVSLCRGWETEKRDMLLSFLTHEKGYLAFVDTEAGTADFADPLFLRFLDALKAAENAKDSAVAVYYGEPVEAVRRGEILLNVNSYWSDPGSYAQNVLAFGTEEIAAVGYPSPYPKRGAGTRTECVGNAYVILKSSARPDLAWEIIRGIIDSYHFHDPDGFSEGSAFFPVLRSRFREINKIMENRVWRIGSDGRIYEAKTEEALEKKLSGSAAEGNLFRYTAEEGEKLMVLCEEAGLPLTLTPYEEIGEIVTEEIGSFLGGVGSAEDCAAKIQSRVSIWLSERG